MVFSKQLSLVNTSRWFCKILKFFHGSNSRAPPLPRNSQFIKKKLVMIVNSGINIA